jgi:hypothetical protein
MDNGYTQVPSQEKGRSQDLLSRALEKAAPKGMRPPAAGGEEVKLYWANYDQYYIKTSEHLHKRRIQWITT